MEQPVNGPSEKPKRQPPLVDKIALSQPASESLRRWLDQANSQLRGIELNKTSLLDWIIRQHPKDISQEEIVMLQAEFHSELGLARWICQEVERATRAGQRVSVEDLLKNGMGLLPSVSTALKKKRKARTAKGTESESELPVSVSDPLEDGQGSV